MTRAGAEAGLTLIEVLVALLLLSTAALGLTSALVAAQRAQRSSARWVRAADLAADGVEQLRAGLPLAPVTGDGGFERTGRVVPDAGRPGVAQVEVTVHWYDGGARTYRVATVAPR